MAKRATPHGRGKEGPDGLTERERRFAEERRKDPAAQPWEIAKRAGYMGDRTKLAKRAGELMRKAAVVAAITSPLPTSGRSAPLEDISDADLKNEIRRRWRSILNSNRATDSDVIKAGDKLMATVAGGYVPMQVHQTGTFTLEAWVKAMGGAPEELGEKEIAELPVEGEA